MKILVGCEESQAVTIELRKLGHEAYSCDLQECSGGHPEWHFMTDVFRVIKGGLLVLQSGEIVSIDKWDMGIFHPTCTFLANSGVRWLNIVNGDITNTQREREMLAAAEFFRHLQNAPIQKIAIENPIPHRHAGLPKYSQIIQPWQFGHGETKATCLWLKGLPELKPTNIVEGREQKVWLMPPGPDRAKKRSKTYPGIARAMAEQWAGKA